MTRKPREQSSREPGEAEPQLARLVVRLRSERAPDPAGVAAIEGTPRDMFTGALFKARAWEDSALPIACGQTISQPYIVGLMSQALQIEKRDRVPEIGPRAG